MFKTSVLQLLTLSLIFLLTACGSATVSQPAPVKEEEPVEAAAPVVETQAEAAGPENELAEKPTADEAMVEVEEVGPAADEAMTDVEEAAPVVKEETTEVEERAPAAAEAMAETETAVKIEEAAAMAETAPQEEIMPEEANVTTAGPTAEQAQLLATLGYQGMPPELNNEVWLNSEPLKLADLHGKVVIVEFWTFACYNCKNVVPSLREWHQKYAGDGLVIIGVHTPEFGFEREIENVKQALVDQDIPYAVAIDNDWKTWRAYNNHYWPAKYFVDKAGNLRHIHIGEGRYQQQEEIIQALLAENVS
jgi:thiol-disulfide isomerase/thioredoxin